MTKKSPCKGDWLPRVGLDKVICTGSSASFLRILFPLGSKKKTPGKLLSDTDIAQNPSPVDCSSHFPRTWKRTCALGWLSGTLHPMRAVPPSSAATAAVPAASKSAKPGERWEQGESSHGLGEGKGSKLSIRAQNTAGFMLIIFSGHSHQQAWSIHSP